MTDLPALVLDFAQRAPADFARIVDDAPTSEAAELLKNLAVEPRTSVLAHLSPAGIDSLNTEAPDCLLECIQKGSQEQVKAVLVRLSSSDRHALVNSLVENPRKRSLKRFMNYPDHSVGTFVTGEVIIAQENSSTEEVLTTIRKSRPGTQVLLQDEDGKYSGIMNPRRVIEGNSHHQIKEFSEYIKPLLAESPVYEIVDVDQWRWHTVLPVVDYENRILGVVERAQITANLSPNRTQVERVQDTLESVLGMYLKIVSILIQALFSKGGST